MNPNKDHVSLEAIQGKKQGQGERYIQVKRKGEEVLERSIMKVNVLHVLFFFPFSYKLPLLP